MIALYPPEHEVIYQNLIGVCTKPNTIVLSIEEYIELVELSHQNRKTGDSNQAPRAQGNPLRLNFVSEKKPKGKKKKRGKQGRKSSELTLSEDKCDLKWLEPDLDICSPLLFTEWKGQATPEHHQVALSNHSSINLTLLFFPIGVLILSVLICCFFLKKAGKRQPSGTLVPFTQETPEEERQLRRQLYLLFDLHQLQLGSAAAEQHTILSHFVPGFDLVHPSVSAASVAREQHFSEEEEESARSALPLEEERGHPGKTADKATEPFCSPPASPTKHKKTHRVQLKEASTQCEAFVPGKHYLSSDTRTISASTSKSKGVQVGKIPKKRLKF